MGSGVCEMELSWILGGKGLRVPGGVVMLQLLWSRFIIATAGSTLLEKVRYVVKISTQTARIVDQVEP